MPDAHPYNLALILAAVLSAIGALLHVACIVGGPAWYRFFGAGERLAKAAERGEWWPAIATMGITLVLLAWSAYGLSAAGVLPALPLLRAGIVAITAVYLLRGLILFPVMVLKPSALTPFVVWSSLICLGYGLVHLWGVVQVWDRL
ncbi:hypothetical protein [Piscinibacter terrae]|uniref:Uncharacterized protein n=1 Tax=Piscinibacter terrae TaxID=2496871 RepID=A0A3N7HUM2_9BURK|nr:hypothetical protein [Albitalea terrae]RQP24641.1 hypothetical protein DZC73_14295 [Albitalea terrae]